MKKMRERERERERERRERGRDKKIERIVKVILFLMNKVKFLRLLP